MDDIYRANGLRRHFGRAIPGDVPQSVAELLSPALASSPDANALIGRSGRYSYRQLDEAVNRAARAFLAEGICAGDRIAAVLCNDVDIVIAFLASQRIGAIWVGIHRPLAAPEKAYILDDCGASLLLADGSLYDQIESIRADRHSLNKITYIDKGVSRDQWAEALDRQSPDPPMCPSPNPFAPAAISYTSGTTGLPKGAVHSQHNILLPVVCNDFASVTPDVACFGGYLPMTTLNMMIGVPIAAFYARRCCVCIDRTDAEGIAEWIRRENVGTLHTSPTTLHDLLTNSAIQSDDISALKQPFIGGADIPPAVLAQYRERFGINVRIGYGMTEAPQSVAWSDGDLPPEPGLGGHAMPQVIVDVRDDSGNPLPAGETGEICVSPAKDGPFARVYTPMLGYWRQPMATDEALRDDVYYTGDIGEINEKGEIYIRGRKKMVILRGGGNIYPAEIERVLKAYDGVREAAVIGLPHERLGHCVAAAVAMHSDCNATEDQLLNFCRENLAAFKVPEQILVLDEMPMNVMAKIDLGQLQALFNEQ